MYVMVVVVMVVVCVCAWSGRFLLQSPEMKLAFLLQLFLDKKYLPVMWSGPSRDVEQRQRQPVTFFAYWRLRDVGRVSPWH